MARVSNQQPSSEPWASASGSDFGPGAGVAPECSPGITIALRKRRFRSPWLPHASGSDSGHGAGVAPEWSPGIPAALRKRRFRSPGLPQASGSVFVPEAGVAFRESENCLQDAAMW